MSSISHSPSNSQMGRFTRCGRVIFLTLLEKFFFFKAFHQRQFAPTILLADRMAAWNERDRIGTSSSHDAVRVTESDAGYNATPSDVVTLGDLQRPANSSRSGFCRNSANSNEHPKVLAVVSDGRTPRIQFRKSGIVLCFNFQSASSVIRVTVRCDT